MGTVNCCEQPKESFYTEEIETHLTDSVNVKCNFLDKCNKSENSNFKETFKPQVYLDKKTLQVVKIQAIVKRFLSKSKFSKRVSLQRLALKEYFRTQGVLCERDDIDSYVHPYVKVIENQIKNREGIYNNPNIPDNLMRDLSYQPFYSIEMPCTYLVDNKDDLKLGKEKSQQILENNKESNGNSTDYVSSNDLTVKRPVYKGHWSIDKKKYGYGILVNPDGSKYEGLFRAGKLDGKGRYITVKGDFFEGMYSNGCASGFGVFIHSDGSIYRGNWMNDLPWGEGEEWSSDGSYYKGDFFKGKKFGIGEFRWKDNAMYLGGVKNDMLHGEGMYTWADGKRYKGYWQENCMHGHGVLENPDGTKYEGNFERNKKQGFGKYWYNKTKIYEGMWVQGKQHGKGKIIKNGVVEEGEWVDGKKVKG